MLSALDIYYGAWANLSAFPLPARAAIVLFIALSLLCIALFLLWFACWPVISGLCFVARHLLNWILKAICLLLLFPLFFLWLFSPRRYLRWCNGLLGTFGKFSAFLQKPRKAKFRFGWLKVIGLSLIIYLISLILIWLPNPTKSSASGQDQPQLSVFQTLYRKLESPALKASASYEPLSPDLLPEVWLSPSEHGKRYDVIIRQYATSESEIMRSISDPDASFRYLWKRDGEWLYVAYDQVKGWVHESLLEKPPERAVPLS